MNDIPSVERQGSGPVPMGERGAFHRDQQYRHDPEFDPHAPQAADETLAQIRKYWASILKNWPLIAAIVLGSIAAGVIITLLMTPVYNATTSIQIEREANKVLNIQDVEPVEQAAETERFLQTQVDLLNSRSLALRVIEELGLLRDGSFLERMEVDPVYADAPASEARTLQREQTLEVIEDNLSIASSRSSRIVEISFASPDSQLAAQIANSFAENYIRSNLDRRFESSSYARDFLEEQLAETKARLEESERQMIAYARRQRLIDASQGRSGENAGPQSLQTANLVEINEAYAQARAERIDAEQKWRQASSGSAFALPEVLANPTIQELVQRRAELRAEYQEQGRIFKDDYPTMQQMAAQIAELDAQIEREAGKIRASIRNSYEVARAQEQALENDVARLTNRTLDEQGRSIGFNILKREADTNRQMYDALLQRFKEIGLAGGLMANNVSIIDVAEPPSQPSSPSLFTNVFLALLAGIALSVILVLLRERFDDTVRTPDDLRSKIGLPLLGMVPALAPDIRPADALADIRSDFSEAYYSVRTSLQFATSHGVPRTLLVTSSTPSEGKSTTAMAMALTFARIGKRVLLIDSDLRKPSLHTVFGLPNDKGFSNVLAGQAPLTEVVQSTGTPNLSFVSCGPLPPNPGELLAGNGLAQTLDEAALLYELVIVDGPPVMGLTDAPIISSITEGTVFVIEAGRTHRGQSKVAVNRLRASHAALLGAILTKFDQRRIGYGTDYAASYSYSYGAKSA